MGISTTQRAESFHSTIKRELSSSCGLKEAFAHIDRSIRLQDLSFKRNQASNKLGTDPYLLQNEKFTELIGKISRWAIDKIKIEALNVENFMECSCPNKYVFKLPCRHTIPQHGPIPLKSINKRWLIDEPKSNTQPHPSFSQNVVLLKHLYSVELAFEDLADSGAKAQMLEKLRNIYEQPKIKLSLPIKAVTKGRPPKSRRDPLLSEHQEEEERLQKRQCCMKGRKCEKTDPNQDIINQLPVIIKGSITNVINVASDGNCGFRVVADIVELDQNKWHIVRKKMMGNLKEFKDLYKPIYGSDDYDELLKSVQWWKGPCSRKHWMSIPLCGYVIANTFSRPLIFFSAAQSMTFLPMKACLNESKPIIMAFVNGNHFVGLSVKPLSPVPPIDQLWSYHADEKARFWGRLYAKRIGN